MFARNVLSYVATTIEKKTTIEINYFYSGWTLFLIEYRAKVEKPQLELFLSSTFNDFSTAPFLFFYLYCQKNHF